MNQGEEGLGTKRDEPTRDGAWGTTSDATTHYSTR